MNRSYSLQDAEQKPSEPGECLRSNQDEGNITISSNDTTDAADQIHTYKNVKPTPGVSARNQKVSQLQV